MALARSPKDSELESSCCAEAVRTSTIAGRQRTPRPLCLYSNERADSGSFFQIVIQLGILTLKSRGASNTWTQGLNFEAPRSCRLSLRLISETQEKRGPLRILRPMGFYIARLARCTCVRAARKNANL
jgi:hypothetical protein